MWVSSNSWPAVAEMENDLPDGFSVEIIAYQELYISYQNLSGEE